MSKALANITDTNFELVKQYLHTGTSTALTTEQQYMLDICLECYGLLKKYPQRNVCINQLMTTKGICYNTDAISGIIIGTKNGLTRRTPRS